MGLDFVNLALRIEEEFNIYLSDATLSEIRTPNDIAFYIQGEYVTKNYSQCSSQIGFYKIRKLLLNEFSLKREQIKPSTSLAVLLEKNIRTNWKKLNRLLENKLSPYPLILTKKVSNIIRFISMGIGTFIFYQHFYLDQTPFIKSFFSTVIFTLFTWLILNSLGQHFFGKIIPNELSKVFHLIRFIGENHKINKYNNYENILEKVIEISIDELGINPLEINEDSDYVEDLGIS